MFSAHLGACRTCRQVFCCTEHCKQHELTHNQKGKPNKRHGLKPRPPTPLISRPRKRRISDRLEIQPSNPTATCISKRKILVPVFRYKRSERMLETVKEEPEIVNHEDPEPLNQAENSMTNQAESGITVAPPRPVTEVMTTEIPLENLDTSKTEDLENDNQVIRTPLAIPDHIGAHALLARTHTTSTPLGGENHLQNEAELIPSQVISPIEHEHGAGKGSPSRSILKTQGTEDTISRDLKKRKVRFEDSPAGVPVRETIYYSASESIVPSPDENSSTHKGFLASMTDVFVNAFNLLPGSGKSEETDDLSYPLRCSPSGRKRRKAMLRANQFPLLPYNIKARRPISSYIRYKTEIFSKKSPK